jgi:hypothetical protein
MRMSERQIVAVGAAMRRSSSTDVLDLVRPSPACSGSGTAGAEDPWDALRIYDQLRRPRRSAALEFFPWPPADLRELVLART